MVGFLRVTGAWQDRLAELQTLAIVLSGRHSSVPDVAPAGVVALLGVAELPPTWLSPPSGVNYAVGLREDTGRAGSGWYIWGKAWGMGGCWGLTASV